jgi:opacity protein-like surface antigen
MRMLLASIALLAAGLPAAVQAGTADDVVRIFGRDPGAGPAYACFVRHYSKAHLASHPDQNVTSMLAFVSRQDGVESYYGVNLQVKFRQLPKPFQVSGSCSQDETTGQLGCGVECDGGSLGVRVKNEQSILVDIPESVRIFDPSAADEFADLPKGARFGSDDKLFRLDRTALSDCAPVIYDDEVKAKVISGAITQ